MSSLLEDMRNAAHQRAMEMDGLHSAALDHAAEHGSDTGFADRIKALAETMWTEVREMEAMLGMKEAPRKPVADPPDASSTAAS